MKLRLGRQVCVAVYYVRSEPLYTQYAEELTVRIFCPEDGGSRFLLDVGICLPNYTTSHYS